MDYHVKPMSKTCAVTGEELEPGSICHSVLIDEHGDQVRVDYSEAGWPGEPPEGFIAYWKSVVPESESADQPQPLEPEELFQFFEQIVEDMNPAQEKMKYVIALLLMQKKRLKMDGTRRDGDVDFLQLSGSQGEGPYEIRDQQLSPEEIAGLQQEMNAAIFR